MRISVVLFLTFVITSSSFSKPEFELEGCFALNSFSNNVRVSIVEKFSYVFRQNMAVSLFGEHAFRNGSSVNSFFAGPEYRFAFRYPIEVPLGIFGGIYDLHIGQASIVIPVIGANTGLFVWLTENVSLRVSYYGKFYFDETTVFGNDIYIGLGVKIKNWFGKSPDSRVRSDLLLMH